MSFQKAGGASRWYGPGNVYVVKDTTGQQRQGEATEMFKIGFSKNPEQRLVQIQKDLAPNNIVSLGSFQAVEANRAETAAQNAVKEQLGLVKDNGTGCRGNATDWFMNPQRASDQQIFSVVGQAVNKHNN